VVDGQVVSPSCGFMLRKAPGNTAFDYGQTIFFGRRAANITNPIALLPVPSRPLENNVPFLPCGFVLKLLLLSSWGDLHYIGLNGVELYDHRGRKVPLQPNNYRAVPSSINDLGPRKTLDVRTVDKLFDGVNDTFDDGHMWLAPLMSVKVAIGSLFVWVELLMIPPPFPFLLSQSFFFNFIIIVFLVCLCCFCLLSMMMIVFL